MTQIKILLSVVVISIISSIRSQSLAHDVRILITSDARVQADTKCVGSTKFRRFTKGSEDFVLVGWKVFHLFRG